MRLKTRWKKFLTNSTKYDIIQVQRTEHQITNEIENKVKKKFLTNSTKCDIIQVQERKKQCSPEKNSNPSLVASWPMNNGTKIAESWTNFWMKNGRTPTLWTTKPKPGQPGLHKIATCVLMMASCQAPEIRISYAPWKLNIVLRTLVIVNTPDESLKIETKHASRVGRCRPSHWWNVSGDYRGLVSELRRNRPKWRIYVSKMAGHGCG